jgi:HSP20 family protein
MALIRWEPARELSTLQSEMNRLFSTFFDSPTTVGGEGNGGGVRRWVPAMDLVESDEQFVLRADLPGLDANDVKIEIEDGVLTVSGERREQHEIKKDGFYRLERQSGAFRRSLTLPQGIDPAAITAGFDKGVLEVRIPKPEESKPRRVEVTVGGDQPTLEGSEAAS